SFLSLLLRRHPRSTLFPYTTLFRLYRVTRSASRTSYPAPIHRLECLSDSSIARLDKEEVVNPEIERLVGMDYKGFLAAVILPQRSEEHTSELQSRGHLVCRLLLEKKK